LSKVLVHTPTYNNSECFKSALGSVPSRVRYDFLLIWGNGLNYFQEILKQMESNSDFKILKILNYKTDDISKLVEAVYSYDYAPISHLKSKIKYLYSTEPEVIFIFFENLNKNEDFLGDGAFRHTESLPVKEFKESIRNRFNARKEDRRSENHVVHASDNQKQTDYILKFLGYKNGLADLITSSNTLLDLPYHLPLCNEFILKKIKMDDLYANIVEKTSENAFITKTVRIEETPHFKTAKFGADDYDKYLNDFQGWLLQDYYSVDKFKNLIGNLKYPNENKNYIGVQKIEDKYVIRDGVHRASILKARGENEIIVGVLK